MLDKVLKEVQKDIPITQRPFTEIAKRLGIEEDALLETLKKLKEDKIIRQISPIYDTRAVGYDSSLVAFKVNPERIEEVANFVNTHPGVSHNYEREHTFNLWFTLAVPPDSKLSLEETVELIADLCGVEEFAVLRTIKTYKIGVRLDYTDLKEKEEIKPVVESKPHPISPLEREVIKRTQEDIPLEPRPFGKLAREMSITEEELVKHLRSLKERGIMRRFSAILYHRKVGFKANGMVVWQVPEDRVDEAGQLLASYRSVSHCYRRTTSELWKFNLFSMVHGHSREEVLEFARELKEVIKPIDYAVLFSTREFKKRRVKLFSEEFYEWERKNLGAYSH
ncbi:MAG: Lrp/AsnC family transcriptional regulator [Aquificae bacterium]|nr:Lrp/AsnC family transcriptional regulator [Aquificota bacterium]